MQDSNFGSNANSADSDNSNERVSIRGEIARVTYRSDDSGYAVVQFQPDSQVEQITVVGYCLNFSTGTHLVLHGHFSAHPKYGKQFTAKFADELQPSSEFGLIRYLGSGLIEGLGEKTAEKIVSLFGLDTLNIIKHDYKQLTKVRGISLAKAEKIHTVLAGRGANQEAERFFAENEIGNKLARRIIERYGEQAINIVKNDPYRLAFDLQGVGFITADSIAIKLGFKLDSPERLRGGLYYALQKAMEDGHCYQNEETLIQSALELLQAGTTDQYLNQLGILIKANYLTKVDKRIYLTSLYQAEESVASFIANRNQPFAKPVISEMQLARSLERVADELGVEFSAEQKSAVYAAATCPLVIVTGGPGCGKTTIIRALARAFKDANKILALAAPTGKAAQRMAQVTDLPASTIHRLLKYDPRINRFTHDHKNPLRIADDDMDQDGDLVDAVIIDEASMLDLQLARDLFEAIPSQATLILVGDKDQLPSVGPGRVFNDLVSIKELKIVALSRLFRRSEESIITTIAHNINAGITPEIPVPDGTTKSDAYFICREDAEDCARLVETLYSEQLPAKFGIKQSDITVLSPANRGPLGSVELNRRIQNKVNPANNNKSQVNIREDCFRLGDKVCQRVNNYKIDLFGVFNGDIGNIYSINASEQSLAVELWDGRIVNYNSAEIGQLALAYAMTVHRSQGSELPCVILVLHGSHYTLLQRQLLYTAVTRAKKLLVIVGSKKAITMAVKNSSARLRQSFLKERIQQLAKSVQTTML